MILSLLIAMPRLTNNLKREREGGGGGRLCVKFLRVQIVFSD